MRRKTLIFLLLFVIVFVVAEVPRLRFTQGVAGVDSVVIGDIVVDNVDSSAIKKVFLDMMDEYAANYYIISGHTQKRFAGSNRIWYERLKVITLPRELVISGSENV